MLPSRFLLSSPPGPRALRLGRFLERTDPLADDVIDALVARPQPEQHALVSRMLSPDAGVLPKPLASLHEWLREAPLWFDEERSSAGGAVLLRSGLLAGLVLAFKSLVLGYCSPGGNKPLAFSGRLTGDVSKRLGETARFVEAVSQPGGLAFGAAGFVAAVRVRLIHARIRHALARSEQWQSAQWGAPINQYDMAGTVLLFSSMLIEGLRQLGADVTGEEEGATLHQWRMVGRLMGVEDELLSTSPAEARSAWALLEQTQGPPDRDSRALTHALVLSGLDQGASEASADFGYALCRHLIGPRYAQALELPRSTWDVAPAVLRRVVGQLERVVHQFPGARSGALKVGALYWRRTIELALGKSEVLFELPTHVLARAT